MAELGVRRSPCYYLVQLELFRTILSFGEQLNCLLSCQRKRCIYPLRLRVSSADVAIRSLVDVTKKCGDSSADAAINTCKSTIASVSYCWFPLVSDGFRLISFLVSGWFPLNSVGFRWFTLVSDGFRWFPMVSSGVFRRFAIGFRLVSVGFRLFPRFTTLPLICIAFRWFPIGSVDFRWFPLVCTYVFTCLHSQPQVKESYLGRMGGYMGRKKACKQVSMSNYSRMSASKSI